MAGRPAGPKTDGRSGIGHILLATVGSKERAALRTLLTSALGWMGLAWGLRLQLAELLEVGA